MIYGKRGSPNHNFYRYCLRYHVSKIFDFRNYNLQPIGPVWFVFALGIVTFWQFITVSNKASL